MSIYSLNLIGLACSKNIIKDVQHFIQDVNKRDGINRTPLIIGI